MNEQNLSTTRRSTQQVVALAADKAASSKVPSGRFAWPFPVARMREAEGGGTNLINSAGADTDGFVT